MFKLEQKLYAAYKTNENEFYNVNMFLYLYVFSPT